MPYRATTGVLLVNLGTPDKPTLLPVWRYLREFLTDPYVINLPNPWRSLLINCLILPTRIKQSSMAYQAIWEEQGSPLLLKSKVLCDSLAGRLGEDYCVELAMRYGQPSIDQAISNLLASNCDKLIVLPLFPHYARATTGSIISRVSTILNKQEYVPSFRVCTDFYQHPLYIKALAECIKPYWYDINPQTIIFSYHGLPEQHIARVEGRKTPLCSADKPCPTISSVNRFCYRAQCYATSLLVAKTIGLKEEQFKVAFQSRLGRLPWIQPYTTQLLTSLANQGLKNIAIVCPSFVVDCLESLEEINIRAKEQWLALGGTDFTFIPCLNDSKLFIEALANLVTTTNG